MDSLRFTLKNAGWAALHPADASAARRAMRQYRKENPRCEVTGTDKKIQVHHIRPVWAAPELAADPDNFISLSSQAHIHIIFGHAGNFSRRYVDNVKEIAAGVRELRDTAVVVHRYPEGPAPAALGGGSSKPRRKAPWVVVGLVVAAAAAALLLSGCATKHPGGRSDIFITDVEVIEGVAYRRVGVTF